MREVMCGHLGWQSWYAFAIALSSPGWIRSQELLTKSVPYSDMGEYQVILHIAKGDSPLPENIDQSPAIERDLWSVCQECWIKEPSMRPTMMEIMSKLNFNLRTLAVGPKSRLWSVFWLTMALGGNYGPYPNYRFIPTAELNRSYQRPSYSLVWLYISPFPPLQFSAISRIQRELFILWL